MRNLIALPVIFLAVILQSAVISRVYLLSGSADLPLVMLEGLREGLATVALDRAPIRELFAVASSRGRERRSDNCTPGTIRIRRQHMRRGLPPPWGCEARPAD